MRTTTLMSKGKISKPQKQKMNTPRTPKSTSYEVIEIDDDTPKQRKIYVSKSTGKPIQFNPQIDDYQIPSTKKRKADRTPSPCLQEEHQTQRKKSPVKRAKGEYSSILEIFWSLG